MSRKKVYLSICILGIFVYPLLFQPWHITQHHQHHSKEHSCETDHHEHQSDPNSPVSIKHATEHCYICDFKFAVKDFPYVWDEAYIVHAYADLQTPFVYSCNSNNAFSRINPRAPPFLA